MRAGIWVFVLLATVVGWVTPAASAATGRPQAGIWETLALDFDDQPLLSFQVRQKRDRRFVTRILGAAPACDGGTGQSPSKLRVNRRGRFSTDTSLSATPGFEFVRGRFVGRRAVVTVFETDRPRCRRTLVLRRTARPLLADGRWRGVDSTGTPIEFYVDFGGIGLSGPKRAPLPLRCSDGSVYTPPQELNRFRLTPDVFVRLDGSFDAYHPDAGSPQAISRLLLQGTIGPSGISGTYRQIQTRAFEPGGPLCDSGPVTFTAAPPPT